MKLRIITDLIIFIAIIHGWWFVALPIAAAGCWFFPYYIEIIIGGFVYDALFGMIPGTGFTAYLGIIISIIIFAGIATIKQNIRR
ncbi:MAG: hypothetical protein AAB777_00080 [Patescibacteria group bacterium]